MRLMRYKTSFSSTLLVFIIVYVIYRIAKEKGWKLLSFLSGAYLFVVLSFFGFILLVILLVFLFLFLNKPKAEGKRRNKVTRAKKRINDEAIDVDFKIKD